MYQYEFYSRRLHAEEVWPTSSMPDSFVKLDDIA